MSAVLSSPHTARTTSLYDGCIFQVYSAATSCKDIYGYGRNVRAYRESHIVGAQWIGFIAGIKSSGLFLVGSI